jgi:hypothetical protein
MVAKSGHIKIDKKSPPPQKLQLIQNRWLTITGKYHRTTILNSTHESFSVLKLDE